jgi:hypothetical protein
MKDALPEPPSSTPPDWPHCGHGATAEESVGCRGKQVAGHLACLAHLNEADRAAYLATLSPGDGIDHRGTFFTQNLLVQLLDALRNPFPTARTPATPSSARRPSPATSASTGRPSPATPTSLMRPSPATPTSTGRPSPPTPTSRMRPSPAAPGSAGRPSAATPGSTGPGFRRLGSWGRWYAAARCGLTPRSSVRR